MKNKTKQVIQGRPKSSRELSKVWEKEKGEHCGYKKPTFLLFLIFEAVEAQNVLVFDVLKNHKI